MTMESYTPFEIAKRTWEALRKGDDIQVLAYWRDRKNELEAAEKTGGTCGPEPQAVLPDEDRLVVLERRVEQLTEWVTKTNEMYDQHTHDPFVMTRVGGRAVFFGKPVAMQWIT